MQLVSFIDAGRPSFGIQAKGGLIDAGARVNREFSTLAEVLRVGALKKLGEMAHLSPDLDIGSVEILPPIPPLLKSFASDLTINLTPQSPETSCRKIQASSYVRPIPWSATGSPWSSQQSRISLTMRENWRS